MYGLIRVDGKVYNFLGEPAYPIQWLAPTSETGTTCIKIYNDKPADDWMNENFNDASWKAATFPYGNKEANPSTEWNTKEIWVRRHFDVLDTSQQLLLSLRNDDDVEVYINGEKVYECKCATGDYHDS